MTTTLPITKENAGSLLLAQTITVEEFNAFFQSTLAAATTAVRQDTTKVKHTDKGGLYVLTPEMQCPMTPATWEKNVASGKAKTPTYNAAINLIDGQWQPFFAGGDKAKLADACRSLGFHCLASTVDFVAGLGDAADVDIPRIEALAMARIEASSKAAKAAQTDEETDEEYADRTADK